MDSTKIKIIILEAAVRGGISIEDISSEELPIAQVKSVVDSLTREGIIIRGKPYINSKYDSIKTITKSGSQLLDSLKADI